MSVTMNLVGTSVPFFKIGTTGVTMYQGTTDPAIAYTPVSGDYWYNTSTNSLHVRNAGATAWDAPRLADITFVGNTISSVGADLTLAANGLDAKIVFSGDRGDGLITSSASQKLYIDPTVGGGTDLVLIANTWPATDGTAGQLLKTNGAGVLSFTSTIAGYVAKTGDTMTGALNAPSFNATSTIRVKQRVKNLGKSYLAKFEKLRPREYDRKDYSAHEFGFIAEEMATIYPEIVGKDKDNMPSGIDYGKLVTILTAKIQEQQTSIDILKIQTANILLHLNRQGVNGI